jgi:hypothetical protein
MFRTVLIANRGAIACRIIRTLRRWKNPECLTRLEQQSRELDRAKRRQILWKREEFLLPVADPYITGPWVPWFYFVSDKIRTEAGPFVTPETIQTVLQ